MTHGDPLSRPSRRSCSPPTSLLFLIVLITSTWLLDSAQARAAQTVKEIHERWADGDDIFTGGRHGLPMQPLQVRSAARFNVNERATTEKRRAKVVRRKRPDVGDRLEVELELEPASARGRRREAVEGREALEERQVAPGGGNGQATIVAASAAPTVYTGTTTQADGSVSVGKLTFSPTTPPTTTPPAPPAGTILPASALPSQRRAANGAVGGGTTVTSVAVAVAVIVGAAMGGAGGVAI